MLLAAIALVQPAMARVRQQWFPEIDGPLFAMVWLSLLVGAIAAHDVYERSRIHAATLIGGGFFLGSRLLALYVVAPSGVGLASLRRFVE